MPIRVPVYTQQRGQVGATPGYRQNVRVTPDDYGAGVGEGIARAAPAIAGAAAGVAAVAKSIKSKMDAAAVASAYAELADAKQSLLEDSENGLVNKKGENALAEHDSVVSFYEATEEKVTAGLSNDEQRTAFEEIKSQQRVNFLSSVDHHVAKEADALAEQSLEGATSAAASDAIGAVGRGELDKVAEAIGMGLGAIDSYARAQGWSAPYADSKRRLFTTDVHLKSLDAMLERGRAGEAKAYLEEHRGEMDGAVLAKSNTEKAIEAAVMLDGARAAADSAWLESEEDPAKAMELIRSKGIENTAALDEALQRVQQRGAQAAQSRRLADAPRLGRLEQSILGPAGGFSQLSEDFVRLSDEGKADALRMLRAEQRSRKERASKDRDGQRETDRYLLALFDGLDVVGEQGSDKVTIDVDRGPFLDGSRTVREQLRARQKSAQTAIAKDKGVSAVEFARQIDERLVGDGVKGSDAKKIKAHVNGAYTRYLNDQKNAGIPPPQEVVSKWIADWFMKGERARSEGFLQPNMTAVQAEIRGEAFAPFGGEAERQVPQAATKVRVRMADGRTGNVAADKVDAFLQRNPGATVVE